jgi:DHA1 family tetracycline resistance protein-like MFS transporter
MQKEKIIIVLTVFIDVLGLGIIVPVLPFYVESFGASAITLTMLFSVYAFFSFVSGPFLGALSDRISRRPVLIASIASTAIGWLVFASAHAIWMLFLGRIIDGLAAGNLPIAQSYLVDIARNDRERTTNLGLIGSVFGVGFIIGPAIGGALSSIWHPLPFFFVGGLAALNVMGALLLLPESLKQMDKEKKMAINPFRPLTNAVRDKPLRSRYAAWFFFGISFSGLQSVFALYMGKVFGFNVGMVGTIYTCMGVAIFLNQTFLLRVFWLRFFKESALELWPFLSNALALALLMVPSLFFLVSGIVLNVFSQSLLRVTVSSRVAGMAGRLRRGEVMGIMSSVLSAAMIAGPVLAGSLFDTAPFLPFAACSLALTLGFVIMKFHSAKTAE